MEPLAALGIASNIIQVVDFASRLISRSHELYQSADGKLTDHMVLDSAAQNLLVLSKHSNSDGLATAAEKKLLKFTPAEEELVKLHKDSKAVVHNLRVALNKAGEGSKNKAWQSFYQALKSMNNDKEISSLASELDNIRKQVDTTLLVTIRYVRLPAFYALTKSTKAAIQHIVRRVIVYSQARSTWL